jgi:plastocyanin domain-containing protein
LQCKQRRQEGKAIYEKQLYSVGKTTQHTKTTYNPQGNIVHVKDKINGGTYP